MVLRGPSHTYWVTTTHSKILAPTLPLLLCSRFIYATSLLDIFECGRDSSHLTSLRLLLFQPSPNHFFIFVIWVNVTIHMVAQIKILAVTFDTSFIPFPSSSISDPSAVNYTSHTLCPHILLSSATAFTLILSTTTSHLMLSQPPTCSPSFYSCPPGPQIHFP